MVKGEYNLNDLFMGFFKDTGDGTVFSSQTPRVSLCSLPQFTIVKFEGVRELNSNNSLYKVGQTPANSENNVDARS